MGPSKFFPPLDLADDDGLLAVGGKLTRAWLLDAYSHGIFPWPMYGMLTWWSPDPRAVLEFESLHVSRRLRRTLRSDKFRVTADTVFPQVMRGCGSAQDRARGTWITPEMQEAYADLHRAGIAHSVEVWQREELVGGVYGVGFGAAFSAESMFYRVSNASKVALAHLVSHLRRRGFTLLDIQQLTPHSRRMGATTLPRATFLRRLDAALRSQVTFGDALESNVADYDPPGESELK